MTGDTISQYERFTKVWHEFRAHVNEARTMSTTPVGPWEFPTGREFQEMGLALACYHYGLEGQPDQTTPGSVLALLGKKTVEIRTCLTTGEYRTEQPGSADHQIVVHIDPFTGYYHFGQSGGLQMKVMLEDDETT